MLSFVRPSILCNSKWLIVFNFIAGFDGLIFFLDYNQFQTNVRLFERNLCIKYQALPNNWRALFIKAAHIPEALINTTCHKYRFVLFLFSFWFLPSTEHVETFCFCFRSIRLSSSSLFVLKLSFDFVFVFRYSFDFTRIFFSKILTSSWFR